MGEPKESGVVVAAGDRQRHDYLTDHAPYAQLYLPRVRENDEHLTRLEYPSRFFNDEHAKRLAEALRSNTRLTALSFPNNQMTDEGLLHLLAPLEKNSSITELNLENNSIGDRATRSLLFTLRRHNHTITHVNLTSNRVSAELLKDLQFSCHLNQQPEMWKRAIVVLADNANEGPTAIELDLDATQTAPEGAHVAGVAAAGAGNASSATGVGGSVVGSLNNTQMAQTGNPFHDQLASVNKAAAAAANNTTLGSPLSQGGAASKGVGWKGSLTEGSVLRADAPPNPSEVLTRTSMVSVQLLSDTLKANTTITRLDLRGNLLGDARAGLIVDALLQNTTLREINLNTNRLTCESAIAFAEVLRTNNTLTELGLANNSIADMGATAFIECLRVNNTIGLIDLHLNTIAPEKINQLLNSLMLNSQPKDLKQLLPDIQLNSSRVDRLNFSTYTADAAQRINDISARVLYNALRQNTTVTYVDLSNNRLTDNGAQQLAYMLEHNYTIQTLLLNNNNIGNNGATALVEALKANAAITRLELDKNPINDFWKRQLAIAVKLNSEPLVFKKVAPALLANDTGVQVVDFSCLTGTLCSVNTCHLLCDVLQHNTSLRELSLARNAPVGVEGVSVICSMLAANKCSGLRTLDVSGIGLHDGVTPILANMLKTNTSLKVLKIGGNPITTAVDFIQVLGEFNHTLIQLECAGTRLSEGDLRDLSLLTRLNTQPLRFKHIIIDLFANNPTLTDLNLCEYEKSGLTQYRYLKCYDDQSMELLCDALISNTHLRSLNVSNNRMTDVGACALATVLQHNSTLTTLNLSNNEITDNGGGRIARALLHNGSVTLVSIDKNKISAETRQRINQAAQTNALREGSLDKRLSAPRASSGQHQLVTSMLGATRAPTEAELIKLEEDSILQDALRDQELLASVARSGAMRQLLVE